MNGILAGDYTRRVLLPNRKKLNLGKNKATLRVALRMEISVKNQKR
jgi:hypothetical protein